MCTLISFIIFICVAIRDIFGSNTLVAKLSQKVFVQTPHPYLVSGFGVMPARMVVLQSELRRQLLLAKFDLTNDLHCLTV